MIFKSKLIAAMLFSVIAISSQAATFSNGGFDNVSTNQASEQYEAGSNIIAPWVITKGNIDIVGTYWTPQAGTTSIDLIGKGSIGEISQTFDTVAGKEYLVEFYVSGNPWPAAKLDKEFLEVRVVSNDSVIVKNNYTAVKSTNTSKVTMNWEKKSFKFIANSTSTTILFTGTSTQQYANNSGPVLDSVSIVKVGSEDEKCECSCECCK